MRDNYTKISNQFVRDGGMARMRTLGEVKVYLVLSSFRNANGNAWPSITTIANCARCSRSNVSRAVRALIQGGWITIVSRGMGPSTTTRYTVNDVVSDGTMTTPVVLSHTHGDVVSHAPLVLSHTHRSVVSHATPVAYEKTKREDEGEQIAPPDAFASLFDSENFKSVWGEWLDHLSECRKPLRPTATKNVLKRLSLLGAGAAVEIIRYSLAGNYTVLYFDRRRESPNVPRRSAHGSAVAVREDN